VNVVVPASVSDAERDEQGSIALDQWRGLALVLVLISHGFLFTKRVDGIGRVGVNLFFFISGILVFRTLCRSRAETAWGRTRSFWWRRLRRLYPALLVYVAVIVPSMWWLQRLPDLPPASDFHSCLNNTWMALFYVSNFHPYPGAPLPLGHLWSLGCEMQFYFLAPLIFLAGGANHRRRTAVFGLLLLLLSVLGAIQPLFPKLVARLGWEIHTSGKYQFEFAAWPMMAGFFCEYRRAWFSRLPGAIVTGAFRLSLAAGAFTLALMLLNHDTKYLVIAVGALLLLPCLLAYVQGRPWAGWPGNSLRWLGERTYSIYLWQQPLTICRFLPDLWHPLGALLSVAIGAASFRAFEYPFLSVNRQKQENARAIALAPSIK
jgi:peptidoglycan/LPS O-acetylase OafA/YrhL